MTNPPRSTGRWNRRDVVRWAALIAALNRAAYGEASATSAGRGYGKDPTVMPPQPSPWAKGLDAHEREAVRWLIDQILPADGGLPAASEVGLVDFFDDWLSAPYREQRADREALLPLLAECTRRAEADSSTLVDWLASASEPTATLGPAFERMRLLTAAAYYTTAAGIDGIGFVGNVPRDRFDGPPGDVLRRFDSALRAIKD